MAKPLIGMVNYMAAQRFDRVVVLYTRHHLELFRAAGIRNLLVSLPHLLAWRRGGPGGGAPVPRTARLALVGQTANLAPAAAAAGGGAGGGRLPIELKAMSQADGLEFYGSSLIGFNASPNADLNLRAFEVMAERGDAADRPARAGGGPGGLWREGRELVTYGDAGELVERARHYLARPDEARAIGAAGQPVVPGAFRRGGAAGAFASWFGTDASGRNSPCRGRSGSRSVSAATIAD